jgi:homoserine dehydrogenase
MRVNALLIGFGNVAQGFVSVLVEKRDRLKTLGIDLTLVGVVEGTRRDGKYHSAYSTDGLDLETLLRIKREEGSISAYPDAGGHASPLDLIKRSSAQLMFEATPTNLRNGEPALTYMKTALELGMHVVTSNKGPLVFALNELKKLADLNKVELKYSAAVAGALPIIPTGEHALRGANISLIEGILNGTTNYILTQMAHRGIDMKDALAEAQRKGIAETDPRLDIQGDDTAVKLLITANSIMNYDATISAVRISGIEHVTRDDVLAATKRGNILRLIGTARNIDGSLDMTVGVEEVGPDHPLFWVNNTSKGVILDTDMLGKIVLIGGESNPQFTAGAMLRDVLNIFHNSEKSSHVV